MRIDVVLSDGAHAPTYAKEGDAGMDLTSRESVDIQPSGTVIVGTGVAVAIPEGFVGLVFPRSGLASKKGVTLANAVGVIDSGYRGEIRAPLHNVTSRVQHVERGDRVCQLVVVPFMSCECVEVEAFGETERGVGGFGSTGR